MLDLLCSRAQLRGVKARNPHVKQQRVHLKVIASMVGVCDSVVTFVFNTELQWRNTSEAVRRCFNLQADADRNSMATWVS